MSQHEEPSQQPRRINIAINPAMLASIDRVIERDQVTLTEAVRRLITYGSLIDRAIRDDGASVLIQLGDEVKQVRLVAGDPS